MSIDPAVSAFLTAEGRRIDLLNFAEFSHRTDFHFSRDQINWSSQQLIKVDGVEIVEPGISWRRATVAIAKAELIGNEFMSAATLICINYSWDVDSSHSLFADECKAPKGKSSAAQHSSKA